MSVIEERPKRSAYNWVKCCHCGKKVHVRRQHGNKLCRLCGQPLHPRIRFLKIYTPPKFKEGPNRNMRVWPDIKDIILELPMMPMLIVHDMPSVGVSVSSRPAEKSSVPVEQDGEIGGVMIDGKLSMTHVSMGMKATAKDPKLNIHTD